MNNNYLFDSRIQKNRILSDGKLFIKTYQHTKVGVLYLKVKKSTKN